MRYRIFLPALGVYAGSNRHWTENRDHAKWFQHRTFADHYALCELDLNQDAYTIESFFVDPTSDPIARQ